MGKFSTIRKIKREIKEIKYSFPNCSMRSVKDEIAPLVLSKIANNLVNFGEDGIEACLDFMVRYRISMDKLKDNIMDLQPNPSIKIKFEALNTQIKSLFTRKYNESYKTSLVRRKKRETDPESKVRYDPDGNVIEELQEDEEEEEEQIGKDIKETKKKKGGKK
jgi:hypothetical protein